MPIQNPTPANPDVDIDIHTDEEQKVWMELPYRVIIHNDKVTTFEFVEKLLRTLFEKSEPEAAALAWITHTKGRAAVCVKPQSEAEALARKGMFAARMEGFPLKLTAEPDN